MEKTEYRPQRLFTAIALPPTVVETLLTYRPPRHPLLNRSKPAGLHLTLCFIGPGYVDSVDELLSDISAAPLQLCINGLGSFSAGSGSRTLWAGINKDPGLMELRNQVTQKLRPLLHRPGKRIFRPHITLARCKPGVPAQLVDDFLEQEPPGELYFEVNEFSLFSSENLPGGSRYTCEKSYPLLPPATTRDIRPVQPDNPA